MSGGDVVAIVGIVGTLGGTLVGYALSWAIERRRWQREDRHRFTEQRRALYARFSATVMAAVTPGVPTTQVYAILAAHFEVLLIAESREVQDAATAFANSGAEVVKAEDLSVAQAKGRTLIQAQVAFLRAARLELGLDALEG